MHDPFNNEERFLYEHGDYHKKPGHRNAGYAEQPREQSLRPKIKYRPDYQRYSQPVSGRFKLGFGALLHSKRRSVKTTDIQLELQPQSGHSGEEYRQTQPLEDAVGKDIVPLMNAPENIGNNRHHAKRRDDGKPKEAKIGRGACR